jgi:hypothetical protein
MDQISSSTDLLAALLGAIVGGLISAGIIFIQFWREDRKKKEEDAKRDLAIAQRILFKHQKALNFFHNIQRDLIDARAKVGQSGDLWTALNPPAHLPAIIDIDYEELGLLMQKKQFKYMNIYQEVIDWQSNLTQAIEHYMSMYREFSSVPVVSMVGNVGTIEIPNGNSNVLTKISLLRTLTNSMEDIVRDQYPEVKNSFIEYAEIMFQMTGHRATIQI